MSAIDLVLVASVVAAMAALAVVDARRMIVDPRLVLALVSAGLLWRLFGSAETGSFPGAALGTLLGVAVVGVPIAVAHLRRRPWPLFPGDAMLLAALGFVLGPLGLGWSLLAGSACTMIYRACLQRRRGRPFSRGYCPLGPGMVAGAMGVFLFVNAGGSLAEDGVEPPLHPGPIRAANPTSMLTATELAPVRVPLPAELAALRVAVDEAEALPFGALTKRLATLAGVRVEEEERPARVAGGAAAPPDPPATPLVFDGGLPGLLNLVTARTGYDWTWADCAIVFYRYWDVEQRRPEAAVTATRGSDEIGAWLVDRERHGTLRAVLADWGTQAGWSVVWKPARGYRIGADASFVGGFLDAVDALLAAPSTRRSLVAFAHEPNRHLVIQDAGAVR